MEKLIYKAAEAKTVHCYSGECTNGIGLLIDGHTYCGDVVYNAWGSFVNLIVKDEYDKIVAHHKVNRLCFEPATV